MHLSALGLDGVQWELEDVFCIMVVTFAVVVIITVAVVADDDAYECVICL